MVATAGICDKCRRRERELQQLRERVARLDKDNARVQRRCARLKKDNERLREQLEQERRDSHRQASPFRRRKLKKRKKKSGRRRGHQADVRPTPTPEQVNRVVNVACRVCPDCNIELVEPGQVVQYQTDLPPIVPIVTQFNIETGWCPCCRRRVQGRHPEQTSDAIGAPATPSAPLS